jgi:hypothetical protein
VLLSPETHAHYAVQAKKGNDGTVSCTAFCQSAQWGTPYEACVSAFDTATNKSVYCSSKVRPTGGPELTCYCSGQQGELTAWIMKGNLHVLECLNIMNIKQNFCLRKHSIVNINISLQYSIDLSNRKSLGS